MNHALKILEAELAELDQAISKLDEWVHGPVDRELEGIRKKRVKELAKYADCKTDIEAALKILRIVPVEEVKEVESMNLFE